MNLEPEVILNVNDTEPARYVTTRILSRAGFKVLEAATGAEALRIARELQPPLVVLDVNLPDISGIEVCRTLKADPDTAATMVLQMSATNIAVLDRVEALGAGADSFLIEPVEPEELEAVARALLRLHRSEASLRRTLLERELLLKEVNHRIKNSLQIVASMLSLQGQELKDAAARDSFAKAIARIGAIAAIHERLYQTDDPLSIEMNSYLTGLCSELAKAGMSEAECSLDAEIESVRMPTEHGVSLALIVNELIINALKHGRRIHGRTQISVRLHRDSQALLRLTVEDNGSGVATNPTHMGLGTRLVTMLVRHLRGELTQSSSGDGYRVDIVFPAHE